MIPAVVAVAEPAGSAARGTTENLVAKADSESRDRPIGQLSSQLDRRVHLFRIPRSVRENDAIHAAIEHVVDTRLPAERYDFSTPRGERARDVVLHPTVDERDPRLES